MVSFGFLYRVLWLSSLVLDGRGWRGWERRGKGQRVGFSASHVTTVSFVLSVSVCLFLSPVSYFIWGHVLN